MTVQEAKKELKELRSEKTSIEHKECELAKLTNKLDNIVERGQKIACFEELQNLYEEYAKDLVKAYRHKLEVERRIDGMPQPFKMFLTLIYLEGKNMNAVAWKLNYNYTYASRIHVEALAYYAGKYSNGDKDTEKTEVS